MTRVLVGTGRMTSRSTSASSTPSAAARQRFSAIAQEGCAGSGSPRPWRPASQRASDHATVATVSTSSEAAWASGTRTSIVPKPGCRRHSHQSFVWSGNDPVLRPHPSSAAYLLQPANAGATPWFGNASASFGRMLARPVSLPAKKGAAAASAASSGMYPRMAL